ncbi:sensor histidine kinase [Leptolyngbya sp. 7M]|uniref:sensor histidine kinase n=1 Tax=Leptolyngbya sp. 7M TaxID=2812896 RepID=UPI001B8BCE66|nr:sensor histidine kinase [Leptolyngbya sp. 7M]
MTSFEIVKTLRITALSLAMFCGQIAANDILDIASPAFKIFTDESGLPSNSVMTIDRDAVGRTWVGTQDGAAYFNGHHWIVVNMPDRNISNYIYDILHSSDESTWFATDGNGVHRLSNGVWTSFGPENGLTGNFGRVLLETSDGSIWAGTRDGLFRFDGVKWTRIELGSETGRSRIRSMIRTNDQNGETVWAGTYGGLVRIKNGETKVFDTSNGMPHNTVFALFDASEYDGTPRILAGTDGGLVSISGDTIEKAVGPEQLEKGIRSIAVSRGFNDEKILWVGTDGNGLLALEKGRWQTYDRKRGLPGDTVFAIADANVGDGSVWISSLGHGIARLERGNWHTLSESHGLAKRVVFSTTEFADGYWFATFGSGLSNLANSKWTTANDRNGLPSNFIYSLSRTSADGGQKLIAGTENGVVELVGSGWKPYRWPELRTETWAFQERNVNGRSILRVGTSRGLVEFADGATAVFNSKNGLPDDRVRDIVETIDAQGRAELWVGTYGGGVARRSEGNWSAIDVNSGLPSNRVLALLEHTIAGRKKLLVGTSGGIAVMDLEDAASPIAVIDTENTPGLLNNYILDLVEDKKGRLYALTNRGVARFTQADDGSGKFDVLTFTTEDGLPSNECVSGSAFIDSKGRLFVGTVEGVAILDLEKEINESEPRTLLIESISVAGQERSDLAGTELNYSDNNIRFGYALLSDFREHATRYKTQLTGFEDKPSEWTSEPMREFSYLPAGTYEFRVWAKDHLGNISTAPAVLFSVRPAWWQTWWAMLLYLLAVAAIVSFIAYLIYRNRLNRVMEIERVRARIATDLHDDIGASLSQIAILSEVTAQKLRTGKQVETKPLADIAETSRDLMNSMSDIVWAINPQRDHLIDLVQRMRRFAIEVVSAKDIRLEFNAPEANLGGRLDLDTRRQIYLIFKEAVNNCSKHANCDKLKVNISRKGNVFEMTISDNGTGFAADTNCSGNGLASMRQRAESVGGDLVLVSRCPSCLSELTQR